MQSRYHMLTIYLKTHCFQQYYRKLLHMMTSDLKIMMFNSFTKKVQRPTQHKALKIFYGKDYFKIWLLLLIPEIFVLILIFKGNLSPSSWTCVLQWPLAGKVWASNLSFHQRPWISTTLLSLWTCERCWANDHVLLFRGSRQQYKILSSILHEAREYKMIALLTKKNTQNIKLPHFRVENISYSNWRS